MNDTQKDLMVEKQELLRALNIKRRGDEHGRVSRVAYVSVDGWSGGRGRFKVDDVVEVAHEVEVKFGRLFHVGALITARLLVHQARVRIVRKGVSWNTAQRWRIEPLVFQHASGKFGGVQFHILHVH